MGLSCSLPLPPAHITFLGHGDGEFLALAEDAAPIPTPAQGTALISAPWPQRVELQLLRGVLSLSQLRSLLNLLPFPSLGEAVLPHQH